MSSVLLPTDICCGRVRGRSLSREFLISRESAGEIGLLIRSLLCLIGWSNFGFFAQGAPGYAMTPAISIMTDYKVVDPIRVHRLPMRTEGGSSLVRVCFAFARLTQAKITSDRALDLLTPMHRNGAAEAQD